MASIIPLEAAPNQSVTANLDGYVFDITVKAIDEESMAVSITADDEVIVDSRKVVSGAAIIPHRYLEKGNFIFISDSTVSDDIPYYTGFGTSYHLLYLTEEELSEALNA